MDNLESQKMELLALENIYDEKVFQVDEMNPPTGRFVAHVRLPPTFSIHYKISQNAQDHEFPMEENFRIEHLPPINLFFRFPETYPQQTCPAFLLSCNWLTLQQLSDLCKHFENLWSSNNDAILYTWFQFLQDEALEFLNITDSLDVTELLKFKVQDNFKDRISLNNEEEVLNDMCAIGFSNLSLQDSEKFSVQDIEPSISGGCGRIDVRAFNDMNHGKILIQLLKNYNEYKKEEIFKTTNHDCDICFSSKAGSEFVIFKSCKHYFCKECIKSYFETQIIEGNVSSLSCPDNECKFQADGSLVRQVVEKELFERYDKLLLSRILEDMPDVTFCPRQVCQSAVLLEPCGRMGVCPSCKFVFCSLCNMAYHGVAPCIFKSEEKLSLFEEYTTGSDATKAELEKRYGKRMLKSLVEDTMSETWKTSNSKNCPHCTSCIEKVSGCNKMVCFKCNTYFCWRCTARLKTSNPYDHFRGECFLFDEIEQREAFDYNFHPGEFLNVNLPFH
ncbi:e3 ubiquitin-protein ligase RNF14 [Caerostris darwini]|uniref:RBR-type E3 ubiquitin transferase n=1 Tax=Caerostris darwini TaxID=1538125 RepID=A0AAV4MFH0_9ARAC|nr:e3 ubiquitin-protein ligase RNF14 [Caerostris darwini]